MRYVGEWLIKYFGWLACLICIAVFQATWPNMLKIQDVSPNLLVLAVVYTALVRGEVWAMITAFLSGIYLDVLTNAVLGHHPLALVPMGFVVGRVAARLVTEHPAVKAGLVLLACLLFGMLFLFIAFLQQPATGVVRLFIVSAVPTAFYTALITPFVFAVFGRFLKRTD